MTCATVTGSGPPFTTCTVIRPGARCTRSTVSSSTGGAPRRSVESRPPLATSSESAPSRPSGARKSSQRRVMRSSYPPGNPHPQGCAQCDTALQGQCCTGRMLQPVDSCQGSLPHVEQPHPSELRELGLVRVEHELSRVPVGELEDVA